ncbi:nitrilase-related carbon-nitrogen hydrolase [Peribacillus simplex]|uniref:nitrilase-related carbon-nitrogen hydrolase n=1 Tax=Peribacillus simplex TaxID=1478 RepID=UPI000BA690AD|nr:nitrilase-related carbon-nitrogen hydrolase [Peribacillus simplex]PAK42045.1 hypothetical protein CHI08_10945 [Peribacillus simplex]
MFVAMANRVGQLEETAFFGESVIVDPYGRVIAEAGREEEVLSASIDLSLVHESRQQYNYLKERRVPFNIPSKEIGKGIREIKI